MTGAHLTESKAEALAPELQPKRGCRGAPRAQGVSGGYGWLWCEAGGWRWEAQGRSTQGCALIHGHPGRVGAGRVGEKCPGHKQDLVGPSLPAGGELGPLQLGSLRSQAGQGPKSPLISQGGGDMGRESLGRRKQALPGGGIPGGVGGWSRLVPYSPEPLSFPSLSCKWGISRGVQLN